MGTQDQAQHDVESIMRRAAEMGHDPQRVARALDRGGRTRQTPPPQVDSPEQDAAEFLDPGST